ncbi:Holliday junction branch migration protein RuvA [Pontivivens insulae]|uniref:Holliday junction branch migration complex subunit RuvA n=1 Tax=Pontivivens insulae TaxID=1639689 RepID=A0A2R8A8M1_9RHOB|nr:Holliday junction branch migration protein RuvA [Pontivivens insulae]RED18678.1 Holliday junction DNA helicase subunit RuvA [Pontivivens insulae]SPF28576.1 Holliday junction ATP-dependent DNA helicase RuvA [Pontivivens insulae]
MIGKVSGRLDYRMGDHVLVEAGGVGYLVYCSERTLAALPAEGTQVALYTEMVVREDLMQLYGFLTLAEKEWHRLLTSVQGVGAKAALAILGTLGPEGTSRAIALGDATAVKAAPGIGPKIAARVVNELQDKAPAIMALGASGARRAMATAPASANTSDVSEPVVVDTQEPAASSDGVAQADALSALVNLGYAHGEAAAAVASAEGDDASTLIKAALKALAPKG